jgi:diphthamide synthase subunit DPH2
LETRESVAVLLVGITYPTVQVALQFPDELLRDSVRIYKLLKSKIGQEKDLYVLADTSYGRQAYCFAPSDYWA